MGLSPPYPLAVISSGFLVASEAYESYARMLASWGWAVVLFDKVETALEPLTDDVCVRFLVVRLFGTRRQPDSQPFSATPYPLARTSWTGRSATC